MTREEAIAYGKRVIDLGLNDETQAFCTLAISALEKNESAEEWYKVFCEKLDSAENKGEWRHDGSRWKNRFICSACGYKLFDAPTNYCPNCGARMKGGE